MGERGIGITLSHSHQRTLCIAAPTSITPYYSSYYAGDRRARDKIEAHWQKAVRIQEKLARDHPKETAYQYGLAISYSNLALLYRDTGRAAEAEALYRKCEPVLTRLVRAHPENKDWTQALARTLWLWGVLLNDVRRGEEARPPLDRAIGIVEKMILEDPRTPHWQELYLNCLVARMNNSTLLHRPKEGERDWQHGLRLAARLKTWGPPCTGARLDARFGAHALAAARAEHLLKQPGLTSPNRFELAKAYAQAAEAARTDRRLAPTEQGLQADRHAAAAVALLARLSRDGYFKDAATLERLKTDDDLKPLRQRADFQKLLANLEASLR
jgi:Tetratricopeptide repeat